MLAVFVLLSAIRSCTVLRVPKMNSRCQHVASYSNHRLNSSISLYTENIHLFTWISISISIVSIHEQMQNQTQTHGCGKLLQPYVTQGDISVFFVRYCLSAVFLWTFVSSTHFPLITALMILISSSSCPICVLWQDFQFSGLAW